MTHLTVRCVLLLALVQQQILASRQIINEGGEFYHYCHTGDYPLQFFREKSEVRMFDFRAYSDKRQMISNDVTIEPIIANYTDRYTVQKIHRIYNLTIHNVIESDSGWYSCRSFGTTSTVELLVPGPLDGVFWTSNYSRLSLDVARQHEIPDGGTTLTDNVWHGPNAVCVVLVSNLQPEVNITIGRFGEPGSVDITDQFETVASSVASPFEGGTRYRATVFFVKKFEFRKSLRDVFCRASLRGRSYEKSVNIQIISKPPKRHCDRKYFAAMVGDKNVILTCLIEAHPEPYVEWMLPSGVKINALSSNPNYTVTNEVRFEGLFTTLTISEVKDAYNYGRIKINATNSQGTGEQHLYFREGERAAAAGITRSSAALVTMMMPLLVWILK